MPTPTTDPWYGGSYDALIGSRSRAYPYPQSFLHNRLGGLQVLPPGSDKWFYIKVRALPHVLFLSADVHMPKPLPGHAICNIGDSLNIFSGGILRSNIHRVV